MKRKVLIVAHNSRFIAQFELSNIQLLTEMGLEVHCATNFENETMIINAREQIENAGAIIHQISIERLRFRPSVFLHNLEAYFQLKQLLKIEEYAAVHCHTPMGGVVARLAARSARRKGTKVIYTAHGFHFFKGASLVNWMIYFPVERMLSRVTDTLVTINREDYALAQRKMKARKVVHVPGVGIDLEKFQNVTVDKIGKRKILGVPEEATLLISVGEVNKNKNHQIIIRAIKEMPNVYYIIAGMGELQEYLQQLIVDNQLSERVKLLGFRKDIAELCNVADIFCFPSHREGLGLAALEAMACGLPLITSNIHGINDYSIDGVTGYKCDPDNVSEFKKAIMKLVDDPMVTKQMGEENRKAVTQYSIHVAKKRMEEIYADSIVYRDRGV